MSRRLVELASGIVALAFLGVVLYNATLVDRVPPSIDRVYLSAPAPGNDRIGEAQTAIDVQFSEAVRTAGVESRFHITPYVAGAFSWEGSRTLIFTPSEKLPPSSSYTISLGPGFEDLAGNANDSGLTGWAFQTVGPPAVVDSSPAPGATDVAVDTVVKLTFDRLMDTAGVVRAVRIDPAAGYEASWSGPVLTLTLHAPLAFATTYTVTVGTDAAGTDGTHLAAPFATSFTTVAAGLVALTTVPAPAVAGVSVHTPIAIVYDGLLDPATIANSLSITPSVAGDLRTVDLPDDMHPAQAASPAPSSGAGGGHVLLFSPSQPLAPHTTYTVVLRPVVRRLGVPGEVAAGVSWTFTTGQPTASAQNQIAFLSARSGVRNVWLMNPDGSNPRQVTTELVPVSSYDVSADGTTIVYATAGVVRRMKLDGSDTQLLTQPGREEYAPLLTPDGGGVVVGRRDATGTDLGYWRVPLPGGTGDERQLTADGAPPLGSAGLGGDGLPPGPGVSQWGRRGAFSSDGKSLLITGGDGVVRLVDMTAPAGSAPTRLTLVGQDGPAWDAVDGSFYVIARDGPSGESAAWQVTTKGTVTRLYPAAAGIAVSGTGAFALLVEQVPSRAHLAYASRGQSPRQILGDPLLVDRAPSFAPDNDSILFGRVAIAQPYRSAGIWVIGVDGGNIQQLSTDGVAPRWLP